MAARKPLVYVGNNVSELPIGDTIEGVVVQTIAPGDTTHAPSGDAVFDALTGKFDKAGGEITGQLSVSGAAVPGGCSIAGVGFVFSRGATAGFSFENRTGGSGWALYATSGTARINLDGTGDLWEWGATAFQPTADNSKQIGSSGRRITQLYAVNGTINTSDAREKALLRDHADAEMVAALDLARLRPLWKWIAAIAEKGEDLARWHCSPTVQDCIAVMEAHNLDPFAFGFICYDQWPERVEPAEYETIETAPAVTFDHPAIYERTQVYTADGQPERFAERLVSPAWTEVVTPAVAEQRLVRAEVVHPAADRYSLRPSELEAFCRRGMMQKIDSMDARLAALGG